jgi:hypothetical protein
MPKDIKTDTQIKKLRGNVDYPIIKVTELTPSITNQSGNIDSGDIDLKDVKNCSYLSLASGAFAIACEKEITDSPSKVYFILCDEENNQVKYTYHHDTVSLHNPILKLMSNGNIGVFIAEIEVASNKAMVALSQIDCNTGTQQSSTGLFTVVSSNPNPNFMVATLPNGGFLVAFPTRLGNLAFREYNTKSNL